jgi:KDO2-lipid IV(A) lauroyltransferase
MIVTFGKRISWRLEAFGHALVAALMRLLPAETVFLIGEFVGNLLWPMMKSRREIIIRNLRIACAPLEFEKAEEMAKESFVRTVANLLSSSVSPKAKGGGIDDMLVIENPELLEDACAEGRGVVLLLAHMGNWELLTRMNHFFPKGTKSGAFYRPLNNPILNARVVKLREADGTRLFSKRNNLHQVGGFLRDNGVIGILADQRVGNQGEAVGFFGRVTRVSPLPSLLVRRCKSEVLALSLRTLAPGKWSARYHKVEKPYNSENCMNALEMAMRVSLPDVFWLQERWKVYLGKSLTPKKWLGDDDLRGEKPHRALFWKISDSEEAGIRADFLHGDIEWESVSGRHPQELEEIDRSKPLPIDFILTPKPDPELAKAADRLGIPLVAK